MSLVDERADDTVDASDAEPNEADAKQPAQSWPRRPKSVERILADRGLCAVLAIVFVWCAVMYLHVWRRHDRYGSFDNDLGFHDQFVWLLARGKSFSTVLGLPPFGHNATFGYFLLAPLSWIGLGPQGLDLICTVAVGLGAVPLYLLARDRLDDQWRAVAFGLLWLLHPVVQGNVWETFHPDAMAMTPLLAAYLCASRRRWRWFAMWVFLAMIWKVDVALTVAMIGLLIALRWNRKVGTVTIAVALAWFAFTVGWLIPHNSGGGTVFGPLYGDLGATPLDVASTAVRDPGKVVGRAWDHQPVRYSRDLLAPYGMLPMLSPINLLIGAPQAAVNVLSEPEFTREWRDNHHYQALPMVAMAIALVEAIGWINRRSRKWAGRAIGFAVATSLAATVAWGSLPPLTTQFAHYWSAEGDPARAAKDRVVDLLPADASVSAHYLLVPHLTHRDVVYSFPNPWRQVFYGVNGTKMPDPAGVKFLVMDTNLLDDSTRALWDCIINSGAFAILSDDQGIVYAQRNAGHTEDRSCR